MSRGLKALTLGVLLLLAPPALAQDPAEIEEAARSAEIDADTAEGAEEQDLDLPGEVEDTERTVLEPGVFLEEAEESGPGQTLGIEEIVVTSQRRMSTLQDVPVSVTVFTASDIEAAGMADIRDISAYTPNLEIKTAFAASNPTLFIRGVGLNDYNANAASAVAVYQDDIYMNSPAGQLFQFFDTEGVEVLRGPQGSLYGRNASAGAIRVLSRKPTDEFEANAFIGYGRWNELEVEGAAGGPLIEEVLSARTAFRVHRRDGFVENGCGGLDQPMRPKDACGGANLPPTNPDVPAGLPSEVNNADNWAARTLLRLTPPGSDSDWLLNLHGGQNRSLATQLHHVGVQPSHGKQDARGYPDTTTLQEENAANPYRGDYNKIGDEDLDVFGVSVTGNVPLGGLELTSISGYEWNDRLVEDNTDAGPNLLIEADFHDSTWQFSQDLRLGSDAAEDFSWVVGGFYLMEQLRADNDWRDLRRFTNQSFDQDLWTVAGYAHFAWRFLESFTLEGGARYNWERKTFDIVSASQFGAAEVRQLSGSSVKIWSSPTWDLSLSYDLSDDATVYAKYSRGWKGGHFNGGAITASPKEEVTQKLLEPVDPETVDAWEMGVKSFWFDRRLMLNMTGFYYRYKDLQVFNLENQEGALPVQQLVNANDAEVYGIELDLHARPLPGLDIRAQGGWLESQYLDFTNTFFRFEGRPPNLFPVARTADFTGNRLIASPQFTFAAALEYEILLGDWGSLVPRYDFTFKSKTFFDATGGGGLPPRIGDPLPSLALGQQAYWLHNARLAYRTPDGRIEVAAWVRNLADKQYKIDAFDVTETFKLILEVWGEPRTYGLSVSVAF